MTSPDDHQHVADAADHLEQAADLFEASHHATDGYSDKTRELLVACWRSEATALRTHVAHDHGGGTCSPPHCEPAGREPDDG